MPSPEGEGPAAGSGGVGEEPGRQRPSRARVGAVGAMAGAAYGAVVLVAYLMLDRRFFGGADSAGMSAGAAALLGVIAGALLGAPIGALTLMTRSAGAGILTGALILAVLKGIGSSLLGLGSALTVVNFLVGGVYGAIVGLIVSGSVAKSIRAD